MSEQEKDVNADAIAKAVAEATKGMQETISALANELSSVKRQDDQSDNNIVDVDDRRAADQATLRTVDGVVIKDMRLENKSKVNEAGFTVVTGMTAVIETVDGKKHKIPYGDGSPESYQNLPQKTFKFVDAVDKTGASKITETPEYTGRTVPERVWEGGVGRLTGRQVRMKVVKEVREYKLKDPVTGEIIPATEKMLSYR